MKLIKKVHRPSDAQSGKSGGATVSRRGFLRGTGIAAAGGAAAAVVGPSMLRKADAQQMAGSDSTKMASQVKRSVCTHCSVGCGIMAEVQNGVWTGQEPAFDHPFNLGSHCAKGASVREHGHGERRLKYPTKLENGKWKRVSWEEAVNDIGDRMLKIREQSGPVPQVLRDVGVEQRRPPGAHLSFHDRGRCCQHLGLRRHDQLLQRHPQQPGDADHRR